MLSSILSLRRRTYSPSSSATPNRSAEGNNSYGDGDLQRHSETIRTIEQSDYFVPPLRSPPQESKPPLHPFLLRRRRPKAGDPNRIGENVGISGGAPPPHRGQVPGASADDLEVQPRRLRRGDSAGGEGDLAPSQEHDVARGEDAEMVGGSSGTWREESRGSVRGDAQDGD